MGATLMVISAMKMESAITSPCAGVVTAIRPTQISAVVAAGQIVAAIAPTQHASARSAARHYGDDTWAPMLSDVRALQRSPTSDLPPTRPTRVSSASVSGAS